MKNDEIKREETVFVEEVPESELYDKKNQSDIIYVEDNTYKKKAKILITIAIILIIIAVLSSLLGFLYLNQERKANEESSSSTNITRYDIFISHSNSNYGGNIKSFLNYNNKDKAFSYSFKVSNENPVNIDYKVELIDNNFGNTSLNLISYSLLNNNEEIASGVLENKEVNKIADVTINSNSVNDLVLKLWSNSLDKGFNFKVNVVV